MIPAEDRADREADRLLRLLPEAADRALPADRLARDRETLMQHIHDKTLHSDLEAEPRPGMRPTSRSVLRTRMTLRPAGLTALALTAAVAVAGTVILHAGGGAGGAAPVPIVTLHAGEVAQASVVLDQMADAAEASPARPVASGEYVYVKTISEYAQEAQAPWTMQPMTTRETWYAQASGANRGMFRQNGRDTPMVAAIPAGQSTVPPVANPTTAWVAQLPSDPRQVLAIIHAGLDSDYEYPDNVREFLAIGGILSTTVPTPQAEATLYRAAALIPGVVATGDATDAAGRHGFGIAIEDGQGERHEWIFAAGTYRFLGERDYLTRDTDGGKAGMLVGLTAVLARGIADAEGQPPVTAID
ncbi:CU044_5270 family protein [Actinospica robiniae]|uniref:CU044_5270 family protein n=1 Tax=Actinospica robiniae TaxID=304901 RepID=UPI0003FDE3E9|nr:CU044_5270 family protein [Actinospica robiniae]